MFKLDLEKAEEPEIKLPTSLFNINIKLPTKAREFQKNTYTFFIDYVKVFDCVDHNKLWKILQEMEIPDYLTCLLRNLYAGKVAPVRTIHGTTCLKPYVVPNWERNTSRLYIVTHLFNLYAEYIMKNPSLNEIQAGIKIAGRNVNNL